MTQEQTCFFGFTWIPFYDSLSIGKVYIPTDLLHFELLVCCITRLLLLIHHFVHCVIMNPHLHFIAAAENSQGVIW